MKRVVALVLSLLYLYGCSWYSEPSQDVDDLRQKLQNSEGVRFTARITTFYSGGDFSFSLLCETFSNGAMSFSVASPDTIQGISGSMDASGGQITFDDTVLGFPLLTQGNISPVSAPWLFYNALLEGYIQSASKTEAGVMLSLTDRFHEEELRADIQISPQQIPQCCELYWEGQRVLSMQISDFQIK